MNQLRNILLLFLFSTIIFGCQKCSEGNFSSGNEKTTSDRNGDIVVYHRVNQIPVVQITLTDTTAYILSVTSKNDSTFTVKVFDTNGHYSSGTDVSFNWTTHNL